jgi:antirestriction protein ArdC
MFFNLNNDTMTTEQNEIKSAEWRKKNLSKNSSSLRFSEREVDFAYLCGVFNVSGIDGLHTEIQRLKELGKEPHDIIEACRKQ